MSSHTYTVRVHEAREGAPYATLRDPLVEWEFELEINPDALARLMGARAVANQSGVATLGGGAVVARRGRRIGEVRVMARDDAIYNETPEQRTERQRRGDTAGA